jgi:DNA polymerase III subunit delta'
LGEVKLSIRQLPWLAELPALLPATLPHAMLIRGQAGLGKRQLAVALAQGVLCENADAGPGEPCGNCAACHLLAAGTHPDFRLLEPESAEDDPEEAGGEAPAKAKRKKTQIPVSAIRGLADVVSRTAYRGRAKAVVISPAEAMHPSAANALLKMLEEPPPATHFILVSSQSHRLLATIVSRCFQLPVRTPAADLALVWLRQQNADERAGLALAMAGYAPVAALQLLQDADFWAFRDRLVRRLGESPRVLELSELAEAIEPARVAGILGMWAYDMLSVSAGGEPRYHNDQSRAIDRAVRTVRATDIAVWQDRIAEFARAANHPLNRRLSLESLFGHYPGIGER